MVFGLRVDASPHPPTRALPLYLPPIPPPGRCPCTPQGGIRGTLDSWRHWFAPSVQNSMAHYSSHVKQDDRILSYLRYVTSENNMPSMTYPMLLHTLLKLCRSPSLREQ